MPVLVNMGRMFIVLIEYDPAIATAMAREYTTSTPNSAQYTTQIAPHDNTRSCSWSRSHSRSWSQSPHQVMGNIPILVVAILYCLYCTILTHIWELIEVVREELYPLSSNSSVVVCLVKFKFTFFLNFLFPLTTGRDGTLRQDSGGCSSCRGWHGLHCGGHGKF